MFSSVEINLLLGIVHEWFTYFHHYRSIYCQDELLHLAPEFLFKSRQSFSGVNDFLSTWSLFRGHYAVPIFDPRCSLGP